MKKIVCLVLIVVMLFTAACGTAGSSTEGDSITVTDQLGREVKITGEVERIVSAYYVTSSLLVALDAKDLVVGLEMKADTREMYALAAPEYISLVGVGNSKTINVEETAALQPDLVIIPVKLKEFIEQFEALSIPVIAVNPETADDFLQCIQLLAEATDRRAEGEKLINYYTEQTELITNITTKTSTAPSVYISGSDSVYTTTTAGMYQNDVIKLAGGTAVTDEVQGAYWAEVSAEDIATWDPQFILKVSYGGYSIDDIVNNDQLATVTAVSSGDVYEFPSSIEAWDYPTPSSILGLLWLTSMLHPDEYSYDEFKEQADYFYSEFYDINIEDMEFK